MTLQRMDNVAVVVDALDATVAFCYLRGPAGIIVALAEQIG